MKSQGPGNGRADDVAHFGPIIPMPMHTKAADWLYHEIPDPDILMGSVFSTTSRGLFIWTERDRQDQFSLGLACHLGRPGFCTGAHAPGARPYIDGEMSRRLIKRRSE